MNSFPCQTLPRNKRSKAWGEQCVEWAASRGYFNYSPVRKTVAEMKSNYNLVEGKVRLSDIAAILNPGELSTMFVPDKIQHYPVINSKLNVLLGEEGAKPFEWRVVVLNQDALTSADDEKRQMYNSMVQSVVEDADINDQQAAERIQRLRDELNMSFRDIREKRGNELLKYYSTQQNFSVIFNEGFRDACISANEIYRCGIVGGEPVLRRLNPLKLRVFRSGSSNKIEDADMLVYEDYVSPGKVIDDYYDELTPAQVKELSDELPGFGGAGPVNADGSYDDTYGYINESLFPASEGILVEGALQDYYFDELGEMDGGIGSDLSPYDVAGNIRVVNVWWKSKRWIYIVKSIDKVTGETEYKVEPDFYVPNTDEGETATRVSINWAWEGTKIGKDIYVGIHPCLVQHNTLNNPSKCHFGIVGTIYNVNESKPLSLVDMMKPYSHLYDAVHAKLVDLIATNWGKIVEFDVAFKPNGWEVDKWLHFARANKVLIKDSFREADYGSATGKIAGGLNNASKGYIDADWGQSIQNYMNILQWIKDSVSELVGINRQREGNTYSRETVGGIERAVMQSSYVTDWLFKMHEDTKRRTLDCFLDYAKAACRGRQVKFKYILSDGSESIMKFDGDEFAENEYGVVCSNSTDMQKMYSTIEQLGQAAIQNHNLRLSDLARMMASASYAEKLNILSQGERRMEEQQQQQQQTQAEQQMQLEQVRQQTENMRLQFQDNINKRDNDTKIEVAKLNAQAEYLRLGVYADGNNEELRREELAIDRDKLKAEIEQFDRELRFKEQELGQKKEIELKKINAAKGKTTNSR